MNKKNEMLVAYLEKSSTRLMHAMNKNAADIRKNTAFVLFNGNRYPFPYSYIMRLSMELKMERVQIAIDPVTDTYSFAVVIPTHGFVKVVCSEFFKNSMHVKINPHVNKYNKNYWFYCNETLSDILY